jgi:hypothetical protein
VIVIIGKKTLNRISTLLIWCIANSHLVRLTNSKRIKDPFKAISNLTLPLGDKLETIGIIILDGKIRNR